MKSLRDLLGEHEDYDLEAKAAQGRDGQGEVPRDVWETYSAMANTQGGVILLGAKEDSFGNLTPLGIKNIAKVRKVFWDNVNNRQFVNTNLLREQDVMEVEHEGVKFLCIYVPRASRTQRPVYTGSNPLTGTYRRNYEGDYKCNEETVRRMMTEAVEDVRDARVLEGFGLKDLDADSLAAYRNLMKSTNANHPFLVLDDLEFLRNIGGWGENRQTNASGLTLAGLLMFGRQHAILDAVPYYVVDYQERPMPPSEQRWVDRITTDGTWSGNLFDFFRRVYRKLIADVKVPFRLQQGSKRIDESHVHEALREALVNTLIHADFTDRISILIVKRQDFFEFRNPGGLRLPVETVLRGGTSDCRNRRLQKMFQLIGAAEQAGSGFPKILRAWSEQHWRYPLLDERYQPEQTVLRLSTTSLLPPEAIEQLDQRFGQKFRELKEIERLAVVTALVENKVTNSRVRAITASHPSDLTAIFKSLVNQGFLVPDGVGRGTCYLLPGQHAEEQDVILPGLSESLFRSDGVLDNSSRSSEQGEANSEQQDEISTHLPENSQHLEASPQHLPEDSEHFEPGSEQGEANSEHLLAIAAPVRTKKNARADQVRSVLMLLCAETPLSLQALSSLLGRTPDTLRIHYVNPMIKQNLLEYRYPDRINHPDQGYRTVKKDEQKRTETP